MSAATEPGVRVGAPAPGPADREDGFAREQLVFLGHQAAKVPIPVLIATLFMGVMVWRGDLPRQLLLAAWGIATLAVLAIRFVYARRYLARGIDDLARTGRTMSLLSLVHGANVGLVALVFMAGIAPERQAIVTMVLTGLCAGAVPASACRARSFLTYAVPLIGAMVVGWVLHGAATPTWINFVVGLLGLLLLPICWSFVVDSEKMFRDSYETRFENLNLIAALRTEQEEVVRQRDIAEEANRAKSRFLAAASHDLRQPLHALALSSALLDMQPTDPKTATITRRIADGIDSLAELLDSLLDISRLESQAVRPQASWLTLAPMLEGLRAEQGDRALAAGARLTVSVDPDTRVRTDPVLLERVLRNLIDNAIKHAGASDIRVLVDRAGGTLRLRVVDDGTGIDEHDQAAVFEEFYQVRNPERNRSHGLGLGLAIVRRLCALMSIDCRLSSARGQGSTFTLTFAATDVAGDDAPPPTRLPAAVGAPLPAGVSTLLVEDDPLVGDALHALLEAWGCAAERVPTIADARRALAAHAYELVVADYRLPDGAWGTDLLDGGPGDGQAFAFLVVTGDTSPDVLGMFRERGIRHLRKPVDAATLQQALHDALAARRARVGS
jgi:signal transduction histidine kinase/ActR/RegA family two-component response regulator